MLHLPSAICHLPSRRSRAGFTLIEAALTTIIVGTGVLAIVAAQQAYHQKNDWAQHTGTAMLLANEIRELTLPLPLHDPLSGASNLGPELNEPDIEDYDDLDDFAGIVNPSGYGAGLTINPPINALRQIIPSPLSPPLLGRLLPTLTDSNPRSMSTHSGPYSSDGKASFLCQRDGAEDAWSWTQS